MFEAKTKEGRKAQIAGKLKYKKSLVGPVGVFVLSDGTHTTISALLGLAKSMSIKIGRTTIKNRLLSGVVDLHLIIAAPSVGQSRKSDRLNSKKNDDELSAAIAAVNARRTRGFK